MELVQQYQSALPIRQEIHETHAAAAEHWASPGTWWTAEERVAIVAEVRRAWDADPMPPWTTPSSVSGLIPADHILPSAAIDVIWRLTNHVTTLTQSWYESYVPERLSPARYVEIVGMVAQITLTDRFADGLALDRISLPPPGAAIIPRRVFRRAFRGAIGAPRTWRLRVKATAPPGEVPC